MPPRALEEQDIALFFLGLLSASESRAGAHVLGRSSREEMRFGGERPGG